MNWNDIYNAAIDKGINDPELEAKDTAREQVRKFVMQLGCDDLDKADCPEDEIERYCNAMKIEFSKSGNIIDITLPNWVERHIYRKKERQYLEEDIREMIDSEMVYVDGITSGDLTQKQMNDIVASYQEHMDCNISYNDTLAYTIENVLN